MKQVSFSLFPEQAKSFKALVEPSLQSKILRHYVLNEYHLPDDLSIFNQGNKKGLKPEKFLFDEYSDEKLNELVKMVRDAGYTANRSSIMRHVINQLIKKLENQDDSLPREREVRHSSFYFEKGTKEVLEQFVTFRNRNAVIERFILEEYKPTLNKAALLEKPEDPESMRIGIAAAAIHKLDEYVKEIHTTGISRTSLMRDVVDQLIEKLSNTDARQLIAEKRLQKALYEYESVFGNEELKERLEMYKANKE
jgi:hypothetical protein